MSSSTVTSIHNPINYIAEAKDSKIDPKNIRNTENSVKTQIRDDEDIVENNSIESDSNNNIENMDLKSPNKTAQALKSELKERTIKGEKQSPINIEKKTAVVEKRPLLVEYAAAIQKAELSNTGHSWMVSIPDAFTSKNVVKGGPLEHTYKLKQFHAHWGCQIEKGTEHAVDSKYYASELHFVHWNGDLYETATLAAENENGLAVIGVFVEVGEKDNEELEKVIKQMDRIKFKDEKVVLGDSINVDKLIPEKRSYFAYKGSLTTPPFSETVTWIVFENPIKASQRQLSKFRELKHGDSTKPEEAKCITENVRALQPRNGRVVTYVL